MMKHHSPLPAANADDEEIGRYADLLDKLDVGLMSFSPDGTLCLSNATADILLESAASGLLDANGQVSVDKIPPLAEVLLGRPAVFEQVLTLSDGQTASAWLSVNAIPFLAADGSLRRVVLTLEDITDLHELEREVGRLTNVDAQTRTFNFRAIMRMLDVEIRRAQRYGTPFSLAQVGIDGFQVLRQEDGENLALRILAEIGPLLCESLREIDMVGRTGEDEFLLILPNVRLNDAIIGMERLRASVEARSFTDRKLRLTISGGITEYTGENAASLTARSRDLLTNARQSGGNRFCLDGDIL